MINYMSETNQTTIDTYNAHIQEYIDGTPQEVSGTIKSWIDGTLSGLPTDTKILEIGSAFGRDANYIESQGYRVERTDASSGFVELLRAQGHETRLLNILTDQLTPGYGVVFADVVLLHFTRPEIESVISKVYSSLNESGCFAFSLKQGEGENWSTDKLGAPRYFCYWSADTIKTKLNEAGFSHTDIADGGVGHDNAKRLHIVATK